MQSLIERAMVNEDSDVQELRELAATLTVEGDEPSPRIMTDGGRPAPRPSAGWRSPLGGPMYCGPAIEPADATDEWDEERIQNELEKRREARAVAGPEIRADGGPEEASQGDVEEALEDAHEPEPLHVGDHVTPTGSDTTTVVMRICEDSAGDYWIDDIGESVAEYNDADPDEDVYQIVFADRDDQDLADLPRYPYPRSRLTLVEPLHDRDTTNGGEN